MTDVLDDFDAVRTRVNRFVKETVDSARSTEENFSREIRELHLEKSELMRSTALVEEELRDGKFREAELEKKREARQTTLNSLLEQENRVPAEVNGLLRQKAELERVKIVKTNEALGLRRKLENEAVARLTTGALLYKKLGLRFERSGGSVSSNLKLVFTMIDEKDPLREFAFVVRVDAEDKYHLVKCSPSLSQTTELVQLLNQTNDFSAFVRRMRVLFVNLCAAEGDDL